MPNTKIVYSLRIHMELQRLGFHYEVEMRNPKNPHLNCWVYEATPEFMEAFDEIMGGMQNG